jgi:hypothetical protein
VASFKLKDETKPGHRKILVFFLVDPTQQIDSTAQVLPQDIRWQDNGLLEELRRKLPLEVAEMVAGQVGYQMTLKEAKKHRLKLMKEKRAANDEATQVVFGRPFEPITW